MTPAGDDRRGGRRGGLSREDSDLWQYVTRDVRPARGKPRVPDVAANLSAADSAAADTAAPGAARAAHASPLSGRRGGSAKANGAGAPPPAAAPPAPARQGRPEPEPPRPVVLERRKARRIARGNHEIEARLDLHGQTQDEAHAALTAFIRRCHAAGLRTVMVITGKGGVASGGRGHADAVHSGHYAGHHAGRARGVLRRNVPRWLAEPELRPYVISYSSAHVRHGGDGALYVMLRRPR